MGKAPTSTTDTQAILLTPWYIYIYDLEMRTTTKTDMILKITSNRKYIK